MPAAGAAIASTLSLVEWMVSSSSTVVMAVILTPAIFVIFPSGIQLWKLAEAARMVAREPQKAIERVFTLWLGGLQGGTDPPSREATSQSALIIILEFDGRSDKFIPQDEHEY